MSLDPDFAKLGQCAVGVLGNQSNQSWKLLVCDSRWKSPAWCVAFEALVLARPSEQPRNRGFTHVKHVRQFRIGDVAALVARHDSFTKI